MERIISMNKDERAKLVEYLSIKSVANTPDINKANEFLSVWLATFCDSVQSVGAVNPLIRAFINGDSGETLCLYGHYDVQPAKLSDGWSADPFQPIVTKDAIIARGACDNKGQHFAFLCALERLMHSGKRPRFNILILLEGEEEIGSPHLQKYLLQNRAGNQADYYLLVDGTSPYQDRPAIYTGSLGVVFGEMTVDNNRGDLHSGIFGAETTQPIAVLTSLIQGLYKNEPSIDFNNVEQKSFSVNYLSAGSNPAKSIIPGKATAMISYRFSNGIELASILESIHKYCVSVARKHKIDIGFVPKVLVDATEAQPGELIKECVASLEQIGLKHFVGRLQGSLPVASIIKTLYKADSLILSFGSKDNNTHGLNECMAKSNIENSIALFDRLLR